MTWRSLPDVVQQAHEHPVPNTGDLRTDAGALALTAFGQEAMQFPALTNVAALSIVMRPRLIVHEVTQGAASWAGQTDLHSLPDESPRLLRGPWIMRVRRPDQEALFGDCVELGGYSIDGRIYLIGLRWPTWLGADSWEPQWCGGDPKEGTQAKWSPLVPRGTEEAHQRWLSDAARFAVIMALLMEAEGSPVEHGAVKSKASRRRKRKQGQGSEWSVRRINLRPPERRAGGPRAGGGEGLPDGLVQAQVDVRGHLKRQPYGPGGELRKWIYVEGYEARRWVAPRSRVVVGA
jgi:hypothetical protein